MMTWMLRVFGSALICRQTSVPCTSGSMRSRSTKVGAWSSTRRSASRPCAVVSTSNPAWRKLYSSVRSRSISSSTIRILGGADNADIVGAESDIEVTDRQRPSEVCDPRNSNHREKPSSEEREPDATGAETHEPQRLSPCEGGNGGERDGDLKKRDRNGESMMLLQEAFGAMVALLDLRFELVCAL